MSKPKLIDKLSDSHVLALSRYVTQRGRAWRTQLLAAWERAGAGAPDYTPELQQIRNLLGPELLMKLRTCEVLEAGAKVPAARSDVDSTSESLPVTLSP